MKNINRKNFLRKSLAIGATGILAPSFMRNSISNAIPLNRKVAEPFHISFNKKRITDLHQRIDNMNWPEMPFDTGWSAGTNDNVLKDLVKYWRNDYDWYQQQDKLNKLEHFKALVEGEKIHFVHYRGTGKRQPYPLLLLHGWPGSFLEFTEAAPLLVNGIEGMPGFDLVVPSLPGFVFSDAPKQEGVHYRVIARRMHQLMNELGYQKYGVTGGDWGWLIAIEMAQKHPESVVKLLLGGPVLGQLPGKGRNEEEQKYLAQNEELQRYGRAYYQIQLTKPQTLAYSLQDSPVGFLSWILEKYWAWTDHKEDLWMSIDRDFVLNTTMLYWLTGRILSSSRIYYNNDKYKIAWDISTISVPTKWSTFAKDPFGAAPESFTDKSGFSDFRGYTIYDKGGHFPAMEQPEIWAKDLSDFFSE